MPVQVAALDPWKGELQLSPYHACSGLLYAKASVSAMLEYWRIIAYLLLCRDVKYFTETEENASTIAPRAAVPYFL